MLDVLSAADVRRQDEACERAGIGVESLMERAGFAVARAVRELMGVTYGLRVIVVCGKGNNAGDGLVAGRVLAGWGAHVTAVMALGTELSGAAATNLSRFPGRVSSLEALGRAGVIVDALFGVGLSRAPSGDARRAIEAVNSSAVPVVSIDVPSGMDADTGMAPGAIVSPTAIVTLGGLKPGLLFSPKEVAWMEVVDIGVPPEHRGGIARALEEEDARAILPMRAPGANKRRAGVVLAVAGCRAMPGAAALVCGAAVHAGAGLTTLAAPEGVVGSVIARTPEITTIPLPDSPEGTLDEKGAEQILARAPEFDAIAIGPGLSRHPAALEAVRMIALQTDVPMVIDADAIAAFAGDAALLRQRKAFTVLTPHEGELARLAGTTAAQIRADRLAAALTVASECGHAVILKGPGSVITDGQTTYINATGNRGLAQGGTGDVLTGMLASLCAQAGREATNLLDVVAAGAWLHGRTADVAASRLAPHPANASMLIDLLGDVIHEVYS